MTDFTENPPGPPGPPVRPPVPPAVTRPDLPPFYATYSPEIPALLRQLDISLLLSTYQAGKVILLSAQEDGLVQLPRTFEKPMGVAVDGDRMAIATRHSVVVLVNDRWLAQNYPSAPDKYDNLFTPRAEYFVNEVDMHDLVWAGDTLWAVNTLFACLCTIDSQYSFRPRWKPPFVTALAPEDRCHLNGVAFQDGQPQYVTALGASDSPIGWREGRLNGGVLVHVPSSDIVLSGLGMPHSPRLYRGKLYALISLTGALIEVDPQHGVYQEVARLPGYARGLAFYQDYAFVGLSKMRPGRLLGDLALDLDKLLPGVGVVHLPSGKLLGLVQYRNSCEEIYDVAVLPGMHRPGIIGLADSQHLCTLTTPQASFWGKPLEERPSSQ